MFHADANFLDLVAPSMFLHNRKHMLVWQGVHTTPHWELSGYAMWKGHKTLVYEEGCVTLPIGSAYWFPLPYAVLASNYGSHIMGAIIQSHTSRLKDGLIIESASPAHVLGVLNPKHLSMNRVEAQQQWQDFIETPQEPQQEIVAFNQECYATLTIPRSVRMGHSIDL